MYLLISNNGQVLGQTFSEDNAKRHVLVARDKMFTVLNEKDVSALPLPVKNGLLEEFDADDIASLWKKLKKQSFPYWGKISVQRVVRHLYRDDEPDAAYTKAGLLDSVPGATWISITTAITMLKNAKYSRGKTMDIRYNSSDGKYRRTA